jgi:hypothetical protein
MGYARHIGRVGALAVTLGVGGGGGHGQHAGNRARRPIGPVILDRRIVSHEYVLTHEHHVVQAQVFIHA